MFLHATINNNHPLFNAVRSETEHQPALNHSYAVIGFDGWMDDVSIDDETCTCLLDMSAPVHGERELLFSSPTSNAGTLGACELMLSRYGELRYTVMPLHHAT